MPLEAPWGGGGWAGLLEGRWHPSLGGKCGQGCAGGSQPSFYGEPSALHKPHSGLVWDQNQQLLLGSIFFNPDNIVALLVLSSSLRPLQLELNMFPTIP